MNKHILLLLFLLFRVYQILQRVFLSTIQLVTLPRLSRQTQILITSHSVMAAVTRLLMLVNLSLLARRTNQSGVLYHQTSRNLQRTCRRSNSLLLMVREFFLLIWWWMFFAFAFEQIAVCIKAGDARWTQNHLDAVNGIINSLHLVQWRCPGPFCDCLSH